MKEVESEKNYKKSLKLCLLLAHCQSQALLPRRRVEGANKAVAYFKAQSQPFPWLEYK